MKKRTTLGESIHHPPHHHDCRESEAEIVTQIPPEMEPTLTAVAKGGDRIVRWERLLTIRPFRRTGLRRTFASWQLHKLPSQLEVGDISVLMILSFLDHIEQNRGNTARSRNARLAAIRLFFRFLEYRVPACLDQSLRIRAIPMKKTDEALVASLSRAEIQALIDSPDPRTISGARDRAMLHLAFSSGLRVSELVGLRLDQLDLRSPCTIHVMGKGRRERMLPLWKESATALKAWLAVREQRQDGALFLIAVGSAMTRSGFEYILATHVAIAAKTLPSIAAKRITPHVLRHSCAMHMLQRHTMSEKLLFCSGTQAFKARRHASAPIQLWGSKPWRPGLLRHCAPESSGRPTSLLQC